MGFESFVAFRYLRRRSMSRFLSFMTLVAVGSVAVGTAALILTYTILQGFEREIRNTVIGFSAHVHVGTFRNELVRDDQERLKRLAAIPSVAGAAPFLQREAVCITRDNIDGVMVKGLPPSNDVTSLRSKLVSGTYELNKMDGQPAIVVGRRFAEKLDLAVGGTLVLVGVTNMQDIMSAPKVQCRISGLYETGMAEYFDDLYVFTSLETAQKLFALSETINGYDVVCSDIDQVDRTVDAIQEALGYPFDPRSVFAIYRNLFVWIDLQKELIPVVVGSLIFISVFNIIATLLLFVMEKTQYIGILKALGARQGQVRRIFVLQGVGIGIGGAAIGCALAFGFSWSQQTFQFFQLPQDVYYMTSVPIHLSVAVFVVPALVAVMLAVLSSLIPAWLAARLDPITAIRFH